MSRYFPAVPPEPPATPEGKTRLAKRFRRRAGVADVLFALSLIGLLAGALVPAWSRALIGVTAVLVTAALLSGLTVYTRCPCCGRPARRGGRLGPFVWRAFECPGCGFSPDWGR